MFRRRYHILGKGCNRTKYKDLKKMRPSVKFVSHISGHFISQEDKGAPFVRPSQCTKAGIIRALPLHYFQEFEDKI